jgi:SAM-dependent methyltransferase
VSRHTTSLPPDYFDARYAADPDPWRFATSDYERDKYAATLAALPRARYGAALEIGCSIGVLTRRLAERCATLLALDVAAAALDQARARCEGLPVRFALAQVPGEWPEGTFDLILLSEVVYYLDAADVGRLAERVRASLAPGGDVVLVHWTGETHYPLGGDEAAELFIAEAGGFLRVARQERAEAYRLDVLARG